MAFAICSEKNSPGDRGMYFVDVYSEKAYGSTVNLMYECLWSVYLMYMC